MLDIVVKIIFVRLVIDPHIHKIGFTQNSIHERNSEFYTLSLQQIMVFCIESCNNCLTLENNFRVKTLLFPTTLLPVCLLFTCQGWSNHVGSFPQKLLHVLENPGALRKLNPSLRRRLVSQE